jgi:UDP-N-acetylmuramate dehydrogenase
MRYAELKEYCVSNDIDIRFDEPMSEHTSLKTGGPADLAIFPDETAIAGVVKMLFHGGIPYVVVGNGTNILIEDSGVEGAVIFTNKINAVSYVSDDGSISVQAGCSLQKIINLCIKHGFAGIEGLAGIPGSVGGAVAGNAGSFGYEIKDVITSVDILTMDGDVRKFSWDEIGFEYRNSHLPSNSIIMKADISLKLDDPYDIKKKVDRFIAEKKMKQPLSKHSAGCVFKNPAYGAAGKLIDEAGCKGIRVGGIEVSTLHANFLINTGGGTASDFLKLMDIVSSRVKERFGIILEPEIKIIGRSKL